ncbi:hypothetical protein [Persicobacter psychrovividus]|uniref:Uncharacterized protein n=1 Tax=Persicobacter psychrovividus TaxID=387638 RepID=A0ABM7VKX0_9BACT|nr:hypothetical protein PEPS_39100 [Persicobacter psychrovividus]
MLSFLMFFVLSFTPPQAEQNLFHTINYRLISNDIDHHVYAICDHKSMEVVVHNTSPNNLYFTYFLQLVDPYFKRVRRLRKVQGFVRSGETFRKKVKQPLVFKRDYIYVQIYQQEEQWIYSNHYAEFKQDIGL